MERIEGLVAEGRALNAAYRTSFAMHDGRTLTQEYEAWRDRLALAPGEALGALSDADEDTLLYIMSRWPRPSEVC